MGEYADMSMERDFNNHIDAIDGFYDDYDGWFDDGYGYPAYCPPSRRADADAYWPIHEFPEGDSVLLRRASGRHRGLTFDRVCVIVRKTEKAILFRVDREVETDVDHDILFWLPKSVLTMKKDEKKVYWMRHWATVKNIAR
jgi:hypothetical protein